METLLLLLSHIMDGGLDAIIAILSIFIWFLLWDRYNVQKKNGEVLKEIATTLANRFDNDKEQLISIINQYHRGHISIMQAINEIKILLTTINSKL